MKKIGLMLLCLVYTILLFGVPLGVGDIVPNITWTDSDGGEPEEKTLYDITSQGKFIWINFSSSN
jgi:hypothetical protein